MSKSVHGAHDPVALALVDAVVAARWEANEILSRRSCDVAADLLRGHAGELAHSPFGRDQLLKLALEAAALDVEKGRSPLELGALFYISHGLPTAEQREPLRRLVAGLGETPAGPSKQLTPEFERRVSPEDLTDEELCARLGQEADLQDALWDDPRLTAEPNVRLAMLRSVAGFRERAAELNPSRVLAARRAGRRRAAPGRRGPVHQVAASVLRRLGFDLSSPRSEP
jgi:hypothetical protein